MRNNQTLFEAKIITELWCRLNNDTAANLGIQQPLNRVATLIAKQ
jgi:hypothetical protein